MAFLTQPYRRNVLPQAQLKKPLDPVAAAEGAPGIFSCSFVLHDEIHFYVIWSVAEGAIERSNRKYRIICKGGEYLLYVPKIEAAMAGDVKCELWYAVSPEESLCVISSLAQLSILPPSVPRGKFFTQRKLSKTRRVRDRIDPIPRGATYSRSRSLDRASEAGSPRRRILPILHDTRVLDITYCRFPDGFNYLWVIQDGINVTEHIRVYEKVVHPQQEHILSNVRFQWDNLISPAFCNYRIEIADKHNIYTEVGSTSVPSFEVERLPHEYILTVRVQCKLGMLSEITSHLCISLNLNYESGRSGNLAVVGMGTFHQLYSNSSEFIGKGAFGEVFLVRSKESRAPQYYAAKFITLRTAKRTRTAQRECQVLGSLSHHRLVQLVGAFMSRTCMVLVMDYLWGGELFERILEDDIIKEVNVVPYVSQICEGLEYLHRNRIVHLDIKPENIVCCHPNSWQIKIIDFGLAREVVEDEPQRALYGTRSYIAPEILNYDVLSVASDMWSLGVLTYVLLSGTLPFTGANWPECSRNIQLCNFNYDDEAFTDLTTRARHFVDRLLVVNPRKRMTASEALAHPWINAPYMDAMNVPMRLTRQNLKNLLAARTNWQRLRNVLCASVRFKVLGETHQIQELDGT